MNPIQRSAFDAEIAQAQSLIAQGEMDAGFKHLERAHVIGQAFVVPHMKSHWLMFKVELRRRRPVTAFGQIVRIAFGGLGSAVGIIPTGNTGGSDISMFKRMPIEAELKDIVEGRSPGNLLEGDGPDSPRR
jgi:Protein of unknown function (DUF3703)